jgi:hypothetical protein
MATRFEDLGLCLSTAACNEIDAAKSGRAVSLASRYRK